MSNVFGQKRPFVLAATDLGPMLLSRFDAAPNHLGQPIGVGRDLLEIGTYEVQLGEFMSQVLGARNIDHGPGVIAVDCGANVGALSLRWAKTMTGWGSVLAVEAQERLFYALCGNAALNNAFNLRPIWGAVGSVNGTMRMPVPDYMSPGSLGSVALRQHDASQEYIGQDLDFSDAAMVDVRALTIDGMNLPRCDLLKIDIEGMELDALQGAVETLKRHKPVVMVEMLKCDRSGVIDLLDGFGYELHKLDEMNMLAVHRDDPTRAWITVEYKKD